MPAQWLTVSNANEVRLNFSGDGLRADILYDLLNNPVFQDPTNDKTKIALVLQDFINADLQTRIRTRDLPDEDPDKDTDPARGEKLFWEGNGINRELVSQSTICSLVVWDGEKYLIELRRAV